MDNAIAFASRALTDTEKRWACIEREMGAILFAAERFNFYIYGNKVSVNTDHKPLVSIFKKDINKVSSRLQRILLKLMKYELDVSYLPGKYMYIADMLSRAYMKHPVNDKTDDIFLVHNIEKRIPMSDQKRLELILETKNDQCLSLLKQYVQNVWPTCIKKLPCELLKFHQITDQLSVENDLIFYGDRVIIPKSQRNLMLCKLHEGHLGINKCRARAKESIFWPNINKDISDYIVSRQVCLRFRDNNPKLPLIQHDIPERPWQRIAMDICEYNGKIFLTVMDYYSKWIELKKLNNKTADESIKILKNIFSVHGYPDIIISDNNPFNSYTFKKFLIDSNIILTTSSPNYPRSNGLAEKSVNICKKMLKKCHYENGNIDMYLLKYRNTPIPDLGLSPAQMLFNRRLKDNLPIVDSMLNPRLPNKKLLKNKFQHRRQKQKVYYNKNSKNLAGGKVADKVMFRNHNHWENGTIVEQLTEPRSYLVKDNYGKVYRRNRQHLIVKNEPIVREQNYVTDKTFIREPYFLRSTVNRNLQDMQVR